MAQCHIHGKLFPGDYKSFWHLVSLVHQSGNRFSIGVYEIINILNYRLINEWLDDLRSYE